MPARGKRTHPIALRHRTTVPFFIFFHGRRTFSLHFTIFRAVGRVFFLFSVNPMLQRRGLFLFFSMGLISNSHRVEAARTSSSWKSASMGPCRRPRPCGGCSCPACESIARQRQRICRAIVRRLALDSSRLKSTEDQEKN